MTRFVFNHRNLFSNTELIGKYILFFCRKSMPISQKMIPLEEVDFLRFLKFLHKQRLWKNLTKSWKKDHYRLRTRVPRLSATYLKISSIQPKMNRKVRMDIQYLRKQDEKGRRPRKCLFLYTYAQGITIVHPGRGGGQKMAKFCPKIVVE